jgi:hypothetical protein
MKQQASLLSFFGQSKNNKKRRLISHDNNVNDNIHHQQQQQQQQQLTAQNALKLQKAEPNITEDKQINKNVSVSNDGKISAVSAIKDDAEEQVNDTDTTQSKESDDSSISSSSEADDNDDDDDDNTTDHQPSDSNNNSHSHQKSEYELLRERNIARNNARLKSLGLLIAGTSNNNNNGSSSKKQRRRSKVVNNKKASSGPAAPSRRSSRLNGVKINYTDEVNSGSTGTSVLMEQSTKNDNIQEEEEEEQFKVSPLFDYQMTNSGTPSQTSISTTTSTAATAAATNNRNGRIKTLVPSGRRLVPPAGLNAIYSLQFYNSPLDTTTTNNTSSSSWIVGAGKAGIIALWDLNRTQTQAHDADDDELDYVDPVLSWKGHSGRWIADARFLPSSSSSSQNNSIPSRLLTAGNDGTICHWDLSSTSLTTGAPKLLHQTNKSLHSSGIFSMDVRERATTTTPDYLIVTGSKDKSIAVSKLSLLENSNESTVWRSYFHIGKVASVSFSSSTINPLIASASDDGLVAVHDMRANGSSNSSVVVSLDDTHVKPHSAVWKPHSDSTFVTAGLDDVIKLWDLRNTGKPVMSFHGHVPMSGRKLKRIHRPTFFCSNDNNSSESFILSGGENSHAISMFEVDQENVDLYSTEPSLLRSVFSRGKLPDGSGDVGSMAVHSDQVAVTVEGGEVIILEPKS